MVTLNPFKTLTCHACLQWIQKSLDPEDRYHNEERDAEEEFQFKGIPIAGENDGDSEESWERESWDTGDESTTDKDSLTNNFQCHAVPSLSIGVRVGHIPSHLHPTCTLPRHLIPFHPHHLVSPAEKT
jgi:hypothetical protein